MSAMIIQKTMHQMVQGGENDFSFWTGCGLQNELRTAALRISLLMVSFEKYEYISTMIYTSLHFNCQFKNLCYDFFDQFSNQLKILIHFLE